MTYYKGKTANIKGMPTVGNIFTKRPTLYKNFCII